MKNYKVYYPINDYVRRLNRDHTNFYLRLIEDLKKTYNIVVCEDSETAHQGTTFTLESDKRVKQYLHDCEMMIEDLDNGEYYILSSHDQYTASVLGNRNEDKLKKVLFSQFIPLDMKHHAKNNYHKYHPWGYFKHSNIDIESYYHKRQDIKNYKNELFFRGTYKDRPILKHIDKKIMPLTTGDTSKKYFEDLITHKVAFTVGGSAVGDLCYRDVEYMQMGIPFIKFEYITNLDVPLIPNYHYISIELPKDMPIFNGVPKDRLGLEHHAKMVEDKYKEVINDTEFLRTISINSRKYYEDNLSLNSMINKTRKILGI